MEAEWDINSSVNKAIGDLDIGLLPVWCHAIIYLNQCWITINCEQISV